LHRIGSISEDVISALIKALGDAYDLARYEARDALSDMGAAVVPVLRGALENEDLDDEVKTIVQSILDQITAEE